MFESPRSASVVATSDAVVWMLDRKSFRELTRKVAEEAKSQHLVFLNSVPILNLLDRRGAHPRRRGPGGEDIHAGRDRRGAGVDGDGLLLHRRER